MTNKILRLFAKFEFWYATRFIKLDKHYTFFFDLNGTPGSFAIKFLGKYNGMIVEYTNVNVGENGLLTFDYDIISNVNNCDVKSKRFDRFTSNVMRSIIHNAVENVEKDSNENRNTNLVEPDSQRIIHEEVSPISEERVPSRKPREKTVRRNKELHSEVQQSATNSSVRDQSQGID